MSSRKPRVTAFSALLAGVLAIGGLFAPGASAQPGTLIVEIVTQPSDAAVDALITNAPFEPDGGDGESFVQVRVREEQFEGPPVAVEGAEVSFVLATGDGLADGTLNVASRFTNADGIATFAPEEGSQNPLSIEDENQPFTTDYKLIPEAVAPPSELSISSLEGATQGAASNPFDIWGDGCKGNGCQVNLTPGTSEDTYTTSENVGMGASSLALGGTNIVCPTQQLIFSTNLFFHATTGNGPVFLVSHISEADRKGAPNNGNKVMGWCLGLKTPGPWNFPRQDTNGNGTIGAGDLFVGMAPKCPKKNAPSFAPCTTSQTGDGVGGTIIRGWVPGGDPPRRT